MTETITPPVTTVVTNAAPANESTLPVIPSEPPAIEGGEFLVALQQARTVPMPAAHLTGTPLAIAPPPPSGAIPLPLATTSGPASPTPAADDTLAEDSGNEWPATDVTLPEQDLWLGLGITSPTPPHTPAADTKPVAAGVHTAGDELSRGPAHQAAAPLVVPDKVQLPEAVTARTEALPNPAAFAQILAASSVLTPESEKPAPQAGIEPATLNGAALADLLAAPADSPGNASPLTATTGIATTSHTTTEPAVLRLELPVTHPRWGEQLGERVQWLVQGEQQNARLILNPPALGPVEVRIHVDQDTATANISFGAVHPQVRESLEAALPRLREMLGETGLNLAHVDVGGRGQQTQSHHGQGGERANTLSWPGDTDSADTQTTHRGDALLRHGLGLVDTFA